MSGKTRKTGVRSFTLDGEAVVCGPNGEHLRIASADGYEHGSNAVEIFSVSRDFIDDESHCCPIISLAVKQL
jgi:hypothetical protein